MSSQRKRVTAADVARSVGLSRATVGYVLNDTPGQSIPDETRARVLEAARQLGYRPNQAARALATGHSRLVLLVLPDWPMDHSMRTHLDEAGLALDEAGYSLVTMTPHPGGKARPLWETLNPDLVMSMWPLSDTDVAAIRAAGVRHIIAAPSGEPDASGSRIGFAIGPRLQVEHLLERGRTRIAFAGSADPRLAELVTQRRELADSTCRQRTGSGLADHQDLDDQNADQAVARWIETGVDAVAAYNDDIAALVVGAALRRGIRVPGRLAVIGHDDTPLARLFVPKLSSIRVDTKGLGRYISALALSAITGAPEPDVSPELRAAVVVRETT